MLARSGLVGKNPPGPIWGHLRPFFHGPKNLRIAKILPIFLGGPIVSMDANFKLRGAHLSAEGSKNALMSGQTASQFSLQVHGAETLSSTAEHTYNNNLCPQAH